MNFKTSRTKKISSISFLFTFSFILFSFVCIKKVSAASFLGTGPSGIDYVNPLVVFPTVVSPDDVNTLGFYTSVEGYNAKAATVPSIWNVAEQDGILPALEVAAEQFAVGLVNNITESTINWINSGFNGQPVYVSNLSNFLTQTANQTVGSFINSSPLSFLCQPFQLQIKLALGLGASQTFANQIGCTLTGALANGENVLDSADNGWTSWLQLSQPQNNAYGAYLIAQAELGSQVAANQNSATAELNFGQGALSLKSCVNTTTDSNGNQISQNTTLGSNFSASYGISADGKSIASSSNAQAQTYGPPAPNANGDTTTQKCTVETPGAVITTMLGFSADATGETGILKSALSNGIDSVMNALLSQLATLAINKIKNGILNTTANSSGQSSLQTELNSLQQQNNAQYNNALQIQATGGDITSYLTNNQLSTYGDTFTTTPATIGGNGSSCTGFCVAQINALNEIQSNLDAETNYQNTYLTASTTLATAVQIFASSTACNYSQNNATAALRAQLINENVITNIEGVNENRSVALIPWNFPAIANIINASEANVTILNTAQNAVNAANSNDDITAAMTPVNSTSFDINAERQILPQIQSWLTVMQANYTTPQCPINLSAALAVQVPPIVASTPIPVPAQDVSYNTPTSTPATNNVAGPSISSVSPTSIGIGDTAVINGFQLLGTTSSENIGQDTILLDGAALLENIAADTLSGNSITFTMPTSTIDQTPITTGAHTLSVENLYGTTNALPITITGYQCPTKQVQTTETGCMIGGTLYDMSEPVCNEESGNWETVTHTQTVCAN